VKQKTIKKSHHTK